MAEDGVRHRLEWHGEHHAQPGDAAQLRDGQGGHPRREMLEDMNGQDGVHRLVADRQGQQVRRGEAGAAAVGPGDLAGQRGRRRDEVGADDLQPRVFLGGQQRQEAEAASHVQHGRAADQRQDPPVDAAERGDAAGPAGIGTAQAAHGVAVEGRPGLSRVGPGRQHRVDEDPLERRPAGTSPSGTSSAAMWSATSLLIALGTRGLTRPLAIRKCGVWVECMLARMAAGGDFGTSPIG